MTDQITAPWTSHQVNSLNRFQHEANMHPFTCGALHASGQSPVLEATQAGWICPDPVCKYKQDWAHAFMADPGAWPKFPFGDRHGPTPEEAKAATEATEPDTCRPVEVDGETVRVRGSGELSAEGREALADVVRAAKAKFVAEAPEKVGELQNRLRLAHKERRAKEHQLDDIRRALCDAGFMEDDDPYGHADLAEVIRQVGEADLAPGDKREDDDPDEVRAKLERIRAEVALLCDCCLDNRSRVGRIRAELGLSTDGYFREDGDDW